MGTLCVVATPIGNLSDVTLRAIATLRSVALIACEDTRRTAVLLHRLHIDKPLISYHQHSRPVRTERILEELRQGNTVALVCDAGTPGVNDPGGRLVAAAAAAGHQVVPIPGASALTAALSVAGVPADRFVFYGFLPHKKGRQTLLAEIAREERTVVFYESTHRILKTFEHLAAVLPPDRPVVACRELTKAFETIYRGTSHGVFEQLKAGVTKGEFVVIVGPMLKHLTINH